MSSVIPDETRAERIIEIIKSFGIIKTGDSPEVLYVVIEGLMVYYKHELDTENNKMDQSDKRKIKRVKDYSRKLLDCISGLSHNASSALRGEYASTCAMAKLDTPNKTLSTLDLGVDVVFLEHLERASCNVLEQTKGRRSQGRGKDWLRIRTICAIADIVYNLYIRGSKLKNTPCISGEPDSKFNKLIAELFKCHDSYVTHSTREAAKLHKLYLDGDTTWWLNNAHEFIIAGLVSASAAKHDRMDSDRGDLIAKFCIAEPSKKFWKVALRINTNVSLGKQ